MAIPQESLTGVIGSLVAAIMGVFKAFRFVKEGERGIKLQFGRAMRDSAGNPIIIEPGFVLLIPFVQTLSKHHVRQQSYRFPEQRITLKDGLIYQIGGMIVFKVIDIYKALFEIDNIDRSIDDIGMAAIRDELQQVSHEELCNLEAISGKLHARLKARTSEWGVDVIQFSLPVCAPTPETANLINASLGVKLRLKALVDGLKEYGLTIKEVSHNLLAVLVGIPLTATVSSSKTDKEAAEAEASGAGDEKKE